MAGRGRGPGQVIRFATRARNRRKITSFWSGVRDALDWVLGDKNEHPLTKQASEKYPPDMRAIGDLAREARRRRRTDVPPEYRRGVRECLAWIYGYRRREPGA